MNTQDDLDGLSPLLSSPTPMPRGPALRGRALLIEDLASLGGTGVQDDTQVKELRRLLGPRGLVVLSFTCNRFGHQENAQNEILNCLKYVRPGNRFEPNFMLFEKWRSAR
uniref:Glutathione peroxidase n=1 Tax=Balaenoptera musculus TaxID=9771 RepID=A0A8C0E3X8_BALMU